MKKIKRYLVATGVALAISVPNVGKAVMAYPGLMPMTQSDGSTLLVQLKGDERAHAYFTPDGYLLINSGKDFYYASMTDNGEVTRSNVRANNPSARTAQENAFLNTIDKELVITSLEKKDRTATARSQRFTKTASSGMVAPSNPVPGVFPGTTYPSMGSPKSLVILVQFSDVQFTTENALNYFTTILTQPNYTENGFTGSAYDFYRDSSNGQFTPQFDVVGPVTLPKTQAYYGGNKIIDGYSVTDYNVREMPVDACDILDATIDFSQYDTDGDGIIDNVFIFYAGRGEASGGGEDTVWPHSWAINTSKTYDGVKLSGYACTNEMTIKSTENGYVLSTDAIGTFCHEFGHVIGLPDLYATSYSSSRNPDDWDTMCSGSYNNQSRTPPTFSSWERACLGWLTPTVLEKPGNYTLKNNIQNTNAAYLIPTSSPNEFFMLENRYPEKWDAYVFGDVTFDNPEDVYGNGMLVWHIDYNENVWTSNVVNDDPDHQYVDIVEAHGFPNFTLHDSDAFPMGAGDEGYATEFNYDSKPQLADWSGRRLDIGLENIYEDPETRDVSFTATSLTQSVKAISTTNANIRVNGLEILNNGAEDATIYSINGSAIAALKGNSSTTLPAAGIYIIKQGNNASKLIVR
jgi:M6 family metalloprotease-like protein